MSTLEGTVVDAGNGRVLEAKVAVLSAAGYYHYPNGATRAARPSVRDGAVAGGTPFFLCNGTFTLEVPPGPARALIERGTEYRPQAFDVRVPPNGRLAMDFTLERWVNLPGEGWYSGNTHLHYDETELDPKQRLWLDPRVEDLPVLVVSVLGRRGIEYGSNRFEVGRHELSTADHVIDVGEETRHNSGEWDIGFGHVMLLNLRRLVEPVSRGILVDDSSPDYPPLIDACDHAHDQGAMTLWCHNGVGMEAPVAAVLGRLDGMNLFDPYWMEPEFAIWYGLLNCGIKLPVSTGSDWFLCSSNRVYVDVGSAFSFDRWLAGLKSGKTFVTNGPAIRLLVEGFGPSNQAIELGRNPSKVNVVVEWRSSVAIERVELVLDGRVIAAHSTGTQASGEFRTRPALGDSGWLAARCFGSARNSFGHELWAHTSPIYIRGAAAVESRRVSANRFIGEIDSAKNWLRRGARFSDADQRRRMLQLFDHAREEFARLM